MAGAGALSGLRSELIAAVDDALPELPCVVALSGGADSAVCAWAVQAAGRAIQAVSIDHGLPGSARLMEAAAGIAGALGIEHAVVPAAATGPTEDALRVARYAALENAADPDEVIVLGHTADDQVETVLAHLLRGSGAAGGAGMPSERGVFHRPLLGFRRTDLRAIAEAEELPFADDPANTDKTHLRNRIRHDVLPLLRKAVNPGVDEAILRTARHLRADEVWLDERAAAVPLRDVGPEVWVPVAALLTASPAVAARAARRALRRMLDPYPGSETDVVNVLRVAAGGAPALPLAGDHLVTRQGPYLALHPTGAAPLPDARSLSVPGVAVFGRWVIEARAGRPDVAPVGRRSAVVGNRGDSLLRIRAAVEGDRLGIRGGTKPVFDVLYEAGIPARLRPGWPVVEAGGRMIWVAGIRPAADAAPSGDDAVMTLRLKEAS